MLFMHTCSASGDNTPETKQGPEKTFAFPIYITVGYIITNLLFQLVMGISMNFSYRYYPRCIFTIETKRERYNVCKYDEKL